MAKFHTPTFATHGGKEQDLHALFMGEANVKHIAQKVGRNIRVRQTMTKFAKDLEIERGCAESVQGDISESLRFLNQLFLDQYGAHKDVTHERSFGKYPKVNLDGRFNYNDVLSFRELDVQQDQLTMRDDSRFRYRNKIKPWQKAGARNRFNTENTGLRLGSFQEKENYITKGFAMETILKNNRYNTKPNYNFDKMLGHTDRLQ